MNSISKRFKLYRSPADRLKEIVMRKRYHIDFEALKDVSFSVDRGEALGIIGQNGAGKSTLLKILTGILLPDSGSILIDGKIAGLLELGTGFNPEITGIENIHMNGCLLGMTREEINTKRQEIISFSELGEFVFEPLKTYSSGMVMRLAFSIAIHSDPICFVVDEALSVGDAHFQQKCMNKIKQFRNNGGSLIFVSHDMNAIKVLCDKAILLCKGQVIDSGLPETVVNSYNFLISKLNDAEDKIVFEIDKDIEKEDKYSYGTLEAKIVNVSIVGRDSKSSIIRSGEVAIIEIVMEAYANLDDVSTGIIIRDKYGQDIFGTNTFIHGIDFNIKAEKRCSIIYNVKMDIGPGKYTISAAIQKKPTCGTRRYHWIDKSTAFEIAGNYDNEFIGICKLYPDIKIGEEETLKA